VYDRGENEEHFIPLLAITVVSVKEEADHRESPPLSGRLTAMPGKISLRPAGVEPTTSGFGRCEKCVAKCSKSLGEARTLKLSLSHGVTLLLNAASPTRLERAIVMDLRQYPFARVESKSSVSVVLRSFAVNSAKKRNCNYSPFTAGTIALVAS
jgi:hypothetical protein